MKSKGFRGRGTRFAWYGFTVLSLAALTLAGCKIRIGEGDRAWNDLTASHRRVADMGAYEMHYIDMGQGEPVVMVHGYSDSTYCWHENVRPLLDAGFRVILVDQPGLGRSGIPQKPYTFSIENQAGEVLKLLDQLHLENFNLVGSSMGGGIVLYLSLQHPDRVLRAVVIDPPCYPPPGHGLHRVLAMPGVVHVAPAFAGRWTIRSSLRDVYFNDEKVDEVLVDEYARAMNKPGFLKVLASLSGDYFSDEYKRMTEEYDRLAPPLLIIWGENDKWVPKTFGEKLHQEVSGSRYEVLKDCGHLPHQELPDIVNPILVGFLQTELKTKTGQNKNP